jgi:hypothetical protein
MEPRAEPAVKLVISVDVEEEGLFFGDYPRTPPGVTNVSELGRLEFIPREFGFPLTLLVSCHAALDPGACRVPIQAPHAEGAVRQFVPQHTYRQQLRGDGFGMGQVGERLWKVYGAKL